MCSPGYRFCRKHSGKISEQIAQILWFTEYEELIICDLAAIYGIRDPEELSGPEFVRFARNLIYYEKSAVVAKIRYDQNLEENGGIASENYSSEPVKKITFSDAMKEYAQADDFDVLNAESRQADMGDLFEKVSVPGN